MLVEKKERHLVPPSITDARDGVIMIIFGHNFFSCSDFHLGITESESYFDFFRTDQLNRNSASSIVEFKIWMSKIYVFRVSKKIGQNCQNFRKPSKGPFINDVSS